MANLLTLNKSCSSSNSKSNNSSNSNSNNNNNNNLINANNNSNPYTSMPSFASHLNGLSAQMSAQMPNQQSQLSLAAAVAAFAASNSPHLHSPSSNATNFVNANLNNNNNHLNNNTNNNSNKVPSSKGLKNSYSTANFESPSPSPLKKTSSSSSFSNSSPHNIDKMKTSSNNHHQQIPSPFAPFLGVNPGLANPNPQFFLNPEQIKSINNQFNNLLSNSKSNFNQFNQSQPSSAQLQQPPTHNQIPLQQRHQQQTPPLLSPSPNSMHMNNIGRSLASSRSPLPFNGSNNISSNQYLDGKPVNKPVKSHSSSKSSKHNLKSSHSPSPPPSQLQHNNSHLPPPPLPPLPTHHHLQQQQQQQHHQQHLMNSNYLNRPNSNSSSAASSIPSSPPPIHHSLQHQHPHTNSSSFVPHMKNGPHDPINKQNNNLIDQLNNFTAMAAAAAAASTKTNESSQFNRSNSNTNNINNNNTTNINNNMQLPSQQGQHNLFYPPFNYPNPLNDIENLKDRSYLETLTGGFNPNQSYDLNLLNKMKEALTAAAATGMSHPSLNNASQMNSNLANFNHPSNSPLLSQFIYSNLIKQQTERDIELHNQQQNQQPLQQQQIEKKPKQKQTNSFENNNINNNNNNNNNSYSSISPSPMQMPASSMSAFSSLIHPNHVIANSSLHKSSLKDEHSPSKVPSIFTPPQLPILNKSRASSPANSTTTTSNNNSFNNVYNNKTQSDAFKTRSLTPNAPENYSKPPLENNFSNENESTNNPNQSDTGSAEFKTSASDNKSTKRKRSNSSSANSVSTNDLELNTASKQSNSTSSPSSPTASNEKTIKLEKKEYQSSSEIKQEVKPILNTMIVSDDEDFSEEEDELNERYEMFEKSLLQNKSKQSQPISDEEQIDSEHRSIGVSTDTDDLMQCNPGTNVLLESMIWNESSKGFLILNVSWRGKSYMGTLIDSKKASWAPPNFKDFPKLKSSSGATSSSSSSNSNYFISNYSNSSRDPYSYYGGYGPSSSLYNGSTNNGDLNGVRLCSDPTVRTLRNGKRRYINQFENDLISDIELDLCNQSGSKSQNNNNSSLNTTKSAQNNEANDSSVLSTQTTPAITSPVPVNSSNVSSLTNVSNNKQSASTAKTAKSTDSVSSISPVNDEDLDSMTQSSTTSSTASKTKQKNTNKKSKLSKQNEESDSESKKSKKNVEQKTKTSTKNKKLKSSSASSTSTNSSTSSTKKYTKKNKKSNYSSSSSKLSIDELSNSENADSLKINESCSLSSPPPNNSSEQNETLEMTLVNETKLSVDTNTVNESCNQSMNDESTAKEEQADELLDQGAEQSQTQLKIDENKQEQSIDEPELEVEDTKKVTETTNSQSEPAICKQASTEANTMETLDSEIEEKTKEENLENPQN